MPKSKAIVLFSGGLDSLLAVKILEVQGIEVMGVCFESNFFKADKARIIASELGINLKVVDISELELELVKNPLSGYGKHLNPCIDCHSLMIKTASAIAKKEKFDFIATGEVLGQRPFSQNKESLKRVEAIAGVEVLRPLSAKLLDKTEIEKKGLVNRGRLSNIRGRSRERQLELARKYRIQNVPSPAGGCLLTDSEFSQRLNKMLDYWPKCSINDVELLKYGRVTWLTTKKKEKVLIVIGRHENDNNNLEKIHKSGDIIIKLKNINGPITKIRIMNEEFRIENKILELNIPKDLKMSELKLNEEKSEKEVVNISGLLTGWYAVKARGKKVKLNIN